MANYDDVVRDLAERVKLGETVDGAIDDGLFYTEDMAAVLEYQLGGSIIADLFWNWFPDFADAFKEDIQREADRMG